MSWFERAFDALPDPRTGNAKRHDLLEILTIALTATVCGAESCADFAGFAVDREALFRSFLRLENGVPSHDTVSRIFRLLDPAAFAACFGRFLDGLGAAGAGVIAIDGKTLRRSFDGAARANPLVVVTAFASAAPAPIGRWEMACTGCWTSSSTRTTPDPTSRCAASANAQDGPTTSYDPSSAKCDDPGDGGARH